jgi:hypothetical protein
VPSQAGALEENMIVEVFAAIVTVSIAASIYLLCRDIWDLRRVQMRSPERDTKREPKR